ncbi:MAG: rRNA maturation RNase YbeY [Chloroflexi bacterium]|nr:rRNA maturation RNase YbeY [Chloroflexota bacterium]
MIFLEKIENLTPDIDADLAENAASLALKHQSAAGVDLTIVLSDDAQLHELNRQWMNVDAPTDVLSFPSDEIDPETGSRYQGDILISVERAAEQAKAAGHTVEAEVQLLVIHGVLHLMGHDHATADEKAKMWQAQAEILGQLGLADIQVREQ